MEDLGIQQIKEAKGLRRYFGLMFQKNPKSLYFRMRKLSRFPLHSLFVKKSFIAIWLDENDIPIDAKLIHPGKSNVHPTKHFKTLIELPI